MAQLSPKIMDSINKTNMEISDKNKDIISFFEKDSVFVFVYKKTEKLASAVYIVTNLFSDNEPMKWTLRKKISELVSFTLNYKDVSESGHIEFIYNIKTKALELVSLLEVSFRGGLISQMNYSILKQEFSNLVQVFDASMTAQKESANENITEGFFDVPEPDFESMNKRTNENVTGTQNSSDSRLSHSEYKDRNVSVTKPNDQLKRTNRQNIILNLLKKKKELTIKDIAQVIKDCSEKTIQRELIAIMASGVIKRTGERRWSKYSLA